MSFPKCNTLPANIVSFIVHPIRSPIINLTSIQFINDHLALRVITIPSFSELHDSMRLEYTVVCCEIDLFVAGVAGRSSSLPLYLLRDGYTRSWATSYAWSD